MLSPEAPGEPRDPLIVPRALAAFGALAAGLALAAGCGDDEGDDETTAPGSSGEGGTELTVTLDVDGPGGQDALSETVSCDDSSSDEACEAAGELEVADLAPVAPDTPCTEIYGGPDELRIEGTLNGDPVDETLTRANGCEIDRFQAAVPLLAALYPDYVPGQGLDAGY